MTTIAHPVKADSQKVVAAFWWPSAAYPGPHQFGRGSLKTYAQGMKRMKPSAEAAKHLHKRANVDPPRITAFGDASWATQLEVLKWLRLEIAADVSQLQYFAVTLLLGFLTLLIAPPEGLNLTGTNWLTSLVLGVLLVTFLLLLAVPFLWPLMMDHRDRAVKLVWLAAYEDEIARRQSLTQPVVPRRAVGVFRRLLDRSQR